MTAAEPGYQQIEAAKATLAKAMGRLLEKEIHGRPRLVRAETALDAADPLAWLQAQSHAAQYFWSDRDGGLVVAGTGEADVVEPHGDYVLADAFERMYSRLPAGDPAVRYYGGLRFHPGPVTTARWRPFKDFRFVAPRIELVRRRQGAFLACHALAGDAASNAQAMEAVEEALGAMRPAPRFPDAAPPPITRRTDVPDQESWARLVRAVLGQIECGHLDKVVLARESTFHSPHPFDAAALLSRLSERASRCYQFCFHPAPNRAFFGASPECLYRRRNSLLESEALAGTRPRGRTDAEDRELARALQQSPKDQSEHAFVVNRLREHFGRFCRYFESDETPSVLPLMHVQHLRTKLEGIVPDNRCDAALLEALHPTPAVGGHPRKQALEWLAEHEAFDRGIYAGPVGWVSHDAAEFCVAIRSALARENELAVYAGAGIVAGSDAREEWLELESKIAPMLVVLDHESR